ncbi:peptidylprolyl isomerase [Plesiocystis pacifica]|uniref:peptidylprolyl isomerase n=1 Tax=Plesiocystis pacifica TaxID=191768 RepID=UPI00030BCA1E|nr:peptidylprolyl isomerase [Plesiocystis pacifica]
MRALAPSLLITLGLAVGASMSSALVAPELAHAADPQVLDRIVAVVDDEIILESDLARWLMFDEEIAFELQKLQNPTEDQLMRRLAELEPLALDNLIGRKLMLSQAQTFQVGATEQEVEVYLQQLARSAQLSSVAELRTAVEQSGRYGTWPEYRNKLREDIILYKLQGQLLNIAVSDAQVLERYRELSKGEESRLAVRRLVFRAGEDSSERDAVFKRAKTVVRRLSGGEDFEAVAAELGQAAESEEVTRSGVSRPIGERLFKAKAGDVVGPLSSGQGYVVFLVEEVIASDLLGFEEAKDRLRRLLEEEARQKALKELYEQLRARAHVDIRL